MTATSVAVTESDRERLEPPAEVALRGEEADGGEEELLDSLIGDVVDGAVGEQPLPRVARTARRRRRVLGAGVVRWWTQAMT